MPGWTRQDALRLAKACAIVAASAIVFLPFGQMAAALVIAALAARVRFRECAVVLLAGAIAAYVVTRSLQGPLAIVTSGAIGFPVGIGIASRWRYARTVAVSTAIVCVVNLVVTLTQLGEMRNVSKEIETQLTDLVEGPDAAEFEGRGYEAYLTTYRWVYEHWQYVLFGLTFSGIATSVCAVVTVASRWTYRRTGLPEGVGSFASMRPPEWLVWAVIATVGLWFADRQWPSEALRILSWNAGIGFLAIYWLNGLGILVYGIAAWKPHPLLLMALLMVMIWAGIVSMLPMLGLFDTWSNFRKRIDRLAAGGGDKQQTPDDTA